MKKSALLSSILTIIAPTFILGTTIAACSNRTPSESTASDGFEIVAAAEAAFSGKGNIANLSPGEWALYKSDHDYVRSITPPGSSIVLNHADMKQHRFVLARLRLAGKTAENSPELFKRLGSIRTEHLKKGYKEGTVVPMSLTANGRQDMHYFPALKITGDSMEVVAAASTSNDNYWAYEDVGCWDKSNNPICDMGYTEFYSNIPYASVGAAADLTLTPDLEYEGDSLLIEDTVNNGYIERYMRAPNNRRGPTIETPIVDAPFDSVGDECVNVCLNRTWTGDCDINLSGTPGTLALPLKGEVSIGQAPANYIFDEAAIAAYQAGTAPGGDIRVVLTDVGGGCNVDGNNALHLGMQDFWNTVTLSADKKTLYWNMTQDNVAVFDQSCRQVQDEVELTMNIVVPWIHTSGNNVGTTPIRLTNSSSSTSPDLPCIVVTNSCLAAGTKIQMSNGSAVAIESIQAGDSVSNPYDSTDHALSVSDTAKGHEDVPMVRIQDAAGRNLLMTAMHPIHVIGRGMVMAKYLNAGDSVMTEGGPSQLVSVTREKYDGQVYNLKVGDKAELANLGVDQTTMYANGFLVGDGQIQRKYESIELSARRNAHKSRPVPAAWREDYRNSLARHRR